MLVLLAPELVPALEPELVVVLQVLLLAPELVPELVPALVLLADQSNRADIPLGLRIFPNQVQYMYMYHQHNPNLKKMQVVVLPE
jgi:hypothetical protein